MQKLDLSRKPDQERHECNAVLRGGWIIYTCPQCDYQLWDSPDGDIEAFNIKHNVRHSGRYIGPGFEENGIPRLS